jgi:hypothetical protein
MSKKHIIKKPNISAMEDSDTLVETTPYYIIRSRVVVNPIKKVKNPTYALTHILRKPLNIDAVKLVKEVRENL